VPLSKRRYQLALKNKYTRIILICSLLLFTLASTFLNPIATLAMGSNAILPNFADFSKSVQNGQTDVLRGVYATNALALPVVQQPSGNAGYVSGNDGEATQFRMASNFGNVGLLAHNHLSGLSFSDLIVGQEVRLVFGNGRVEYFVIKEVLKYQALQPNSPYSSFRNLDNDDILSAEQMFKRVYFGDHHVTFQTCIDAEGNPSWGRLFIIAVPKEQVSIFNRLKYKLIQ